jgi:hypothetical protein
MHLGQQSNTAFQLHSSSTASSNIPVTGAIPLLSSPAEHSAENLTAPPLSTPAQMTHDPIQQEPCEFPNQEPHILGRDPVTQRRADDESRSLATIVKFSPGPASAPISGVDLAA